MPDVPEARLAGRAGLAGAVGAELGAVAHVVGGDIQGDQEVLDLATGTRTAPGPAGAGSTGSVRDGISPV